MWNFARACSLKSVEQDWMISRYFPGLHDWLSLIRRMLRYKTVSTAMENNRPHPELPEEILHQNHMPISTRSWEFNADDGVEALSSHCLQDHRDMGQEQDKVVDMLKDSLSKLRPGNPIELIPSGSSFARRRNPKAYVLATSSVDNHIMCGGQLHV